MVHVGSTSTWKACSVVSPQRELWLSASLKRLGLWSLQVLLSPAPDLKRKFLCQIVVFEKGPGGGFHGKGPTMLKRWTNSQGKLSCHWVRAHSSSLSHRLYISGICKSNLHNRILLLASFPLILLHILCKEQGTRLQSQLTNFKLIVLPAPNEAINSPKKNKMAVKLHKITVAAEEPVNNLCGILHFTSGSYSDFHFQWTVPSYPTLYLKLQVPLPPAWLFDLQLVSPLVAAQKQLWNTSMPLLTLLILASFCQYQRVLAAAQGCLSLSSSHFSLKGLQRAVRTSPSFFIKACTGVTFEKRFHAFILISNSNMNIYGNPFIFNSYELKIQLLAWLQARLQKHKTWQLGKWFRLPETPQASPGSPLHATHSTTAKLKLRLRPTLTDNITASQLWHHQTEHASWQFFIWKIVHITDNFQVNVDLCTHDGGKSEAVQSSFYLPKQARV